VVPGECPEWQRGRTVNPLAYAFVGSSPTSPTSLLSLFGPRLGRPSWRAGAPLCVIYDLVKFLHIIGATVILGTGAGIAFFMLVAHLSRDAAFVARTAGVVVLADFLFTATAVAVQPVTGYLLMQATGTSFAESWIVVSLVLYAVAGVFWLPVVWMQMRMRDLARAAAFAGKPLSGEYHRLFRLWVLFGFPGFGSVLAIVWFMVAKPVL
jgi:uncharacterized membrane protein